MSQHSARHASFIAIHGGDGGNYTADAMLAMEVELEAADLPVPETHAGRLIAWLQLRTGSEDSNLGGLLSAFAVANDVDRWASLGAFDPMPEPE